MRGGRSTRRFGLISTGQPPRGEPPRGGPQRGEDCNLPVARGFQTVLKAVDSLGIRRERFRQIG